jgi:hypothetical protein
LAGLQPVPVDKGAVGGPKVLNNEFFALRGEPAVATRNSGIVNNDVTIAGTADSPGIQ